jgi:hypothetical protein
MRGRCEDGVYSVKLCPSSSQAHAITFAGTRASFDRWCHRLGQPSSKLLSSFFHSYNLPVSSSYFFIFLRFVSVQSLLSCVSCRCNMSHKLSFNVTFLMSHAPLEYLYPGVWGQSSRFLLLMAIIIMYFLFIISLSTACFFLYIISRMCLSFLFTLPL